MGDIVIVISDIVNGSYDIVNDTDTIGNGDIDTDTIDNGTS